jgi:hypothetical protein
MQATMEARGINATFGEELLKGKKAEVRKLVSVNDRLGQGGELGLPCSNRQMHHWKWQSQMVLAQEPALVGKPQESVEQAGLQCRRSKPCR